MSTENFMFEANLILKGKIECVTGLHIGGSKEKLEIGGVDSPVLRNPQTRYPYIPGSSLKGKMRYLLEYSTGAVTNPIQGKIGNVSISEHIVRVFGIGADDKDPKKQDEKASETGQTTTMPGYLVNIGPTRLIVRDCNPDQNTINMWKQIDSELLYTEYKPENTIDRLTSAANPRFIERVVEGSCFDFEMIYGIYLMNQSDAEKEEEAIQADLDNLLLCLRLLENSTLGKSGSRGYGRIRFHLMEPFVVEVEDYKDNTDNYKSSLSPIPKSIKELQTLENITLKYPPAPSA